MHKTTTAIEDLIKTNIAIWHNATKIKRDGKPLRELSTKERVAIFRRIRSLNVDRSKQRWAIDSMAGGINETKIDYLGAK
jgi:hypothetical protein